MGEQRFVIHKIDSWLIGAFVGLSSFVLKLGTGKSSKPSQVSQVCVCVCAFYFRLAKSAFGPALRARLLTCLALWSSLSKNRKLALYRLSTFLNASPLLFPLLALSWCYFPECEVADSSRWLGWAGRFNYRADDPMQMRNQQTETRHPLFRVGPFMQVLIAWHQF